MQTSAVAMDSEAQRLASFAAAIDAIKEDVEARIGEADLEHVRRLRHFSRAMEIVGRACIHLSIEPITFGVGVAALFVHKQIEAIEIGHTALHGAYDRFGEDSGFHSSKFWWRVPIDEQSWQLGHNVKHHGNTNIAGKDPDLHFGWVRLSPEEPFRPIHRIQLPILLGFAIPIFTFQMGAKFSGVHDLAFGSNQFVPDRSFASLRRAVWRAMRKYAPYYAYELVLFPALAGPMFPKVLLGNLLTELMRDCYTAATILCNHVGEQNSYFSEGDRAGSKGAWYWRQVESTTNFEVSRPLAILCGGLEQQIEHHLFPKFPPERIREAAPRVKAACEAHGVRYNTGRWLPTLRKVLAQVRALSRRR